MTNSFRIQVRHNFESAHRLWLTPGKCRSIHGHSFWAEVTIYGPIDSKGIVAEFGILKKELRDYLDRNWDHGTILNTDDPLGAVFTQEGICKTFFLTERDPTTENLAEYLSAVVRQEILPKVVGDSHLFEVDVFIQETSVNGAGFHD